MTEGQGNIAGAVIIALGLLLLGKLWTFNSALLDTERTLEQHRQIILHGTAISGSNKQ